VPSANLIFPTDSTPGALTGEGEGKLRNAFAEKAGQRVYWKRVPGLVLSRATSQTVPRGSIDLSGTIYAAYSGQVAKIVPGTSSALLTNGLPGTDGVTWARNNANPTPDLVVCRESGGCKIVTTSAVSTYPDADLPFGNVNSVDFMGGYFLFTELSGKLWATDLNTTATNGLSFTTCDAQPDQLYRVFVSGNIAYAMGASTIECYYNAGSSPFPLQRHATVIPVGLLTTMAVAGQREGWDHAPYFVAHDRTVRSLDGFRAPKVSTVDVDRFLTASTASTIEAGTYTFRGNAIWYVSSDQGTYEYNVNSGGWNERLSTGLTKWRGSRSVKSGSDWYVSDTQDGSLQKISTTTYVENGAALTFRIESAPLMEFPVRGATPDIFLNFTPASMNCLVSNSMDGGATWSSPVTRSLLASADPVRINRIGTTSHHGLRIRIDVSDAGDFSFMGGSVPRLQPRAP
jgi:hypothetical protein